MPIIPSPTHGGWIRVPPPRRRPNPQAQANALATPLAFFACQPIPSKLTPNKPPPCPKYDFYPPSPPPTIKKKKSRTVSAPPAIVENDNDDDYDYDDDIISEHLEDDDGIASLNDYKSTRSYERARQPESVSRRTVSAAPRAPASSRAQRGEPQGKYWTGPSNRHSVAAPRRDYAREAGSGSRSVVSASWANATRALDLG